MFATKPPTIGSSLWPEKREKADRGGAADVDVANEFSQQPAGRAPAPETANPKSLQNLCSRSLHLVSDLQQSAFGGVYQPVSEGGSAATVPMLSPEECRTPCRKWSNSNQVQDSQLEATILLRTRRCSDRKSVV